MWPAIICQLVVFFPGSYVYTESSYKSATNDTARLISDSLTLTDAGVCLRFWYNMYGSDIGSLRVYTSIRGRFDYKWIGWVHRDRSSPVSLSPLCYMNFRSNMLRKTPRVHMEKSLEYLIHQASTVSCNYTAQSYTQYILACTKCVHIAPDKRKL